VLEGLGWQVHRIWSTDWWHDAPAETERLVTRLREIGAKTGNASQAGGPQGGSGEPLKNPPTGASS
jgi:hypothetical protein